MTMAAARPMSDGLNLSGERDEDCLCRLPFLLSDGLGGNSRQDSSFLISDADLAVLSSSTATEDVFSILTEPERFSPNLTPQLLEWMEDSGDGTVDGGGGGEDGGGAGNKGGRGDMLAMTKPTPEPSAVFITGESSCRAVPSSGDPQLFEGLHQLGGSLLSVRETSLLLDCWTAFQVLESGSSDAVFSGDIPAIAGQQPPSPMSLALHGEEPYDGTDKTEGTHCSLAVGGENISARSLSAEGTFSSLADVNGDVGGVFIASNDPVGGLVVEPGAATAVAEIATAAAATVTAAAAAVATDVAAVEVAAAEAAVEEAAMAAVYAILDDPTEEGAAVAAEDLTGLCVGGDPADSTMGDSANESNNGSAVTAFVVAAAATAPTPSVATAGVAATAVPTATHGAAAAVHMAAGKSTSTKTALLRRRRRRQERKAWLIHAYLVASLPGSAAHRLLPSKADMKALANRLREELEKVHNWFKNARRPERFEKLRVNFQREGVTLVRENLRRGRPKKIGTR